MFEDILNRTKQNQSREHEMDATYTNWLPHTGVSFETRQTKYELKKENLFPEP